MLGIINMFVMIRNELSTMEIITIRTNVYSSTTTPTTTTPPFRSIGPLPAATEFLSNPQLTEHDDETIQSSTNIATKSNNIPFALVDRLQKEEMTDATLDMGSDNLSFIATVREYPTGNTPATNAQTPNFYDILHMFDCLPSGPCLECLATEDEAQGGNCELCHAYCSCFCKSLCRVRPLPKPLTAEWRVKQPSDSKDLNRLIPRIIHQTWFEPVTKEKYPKMSQLVHSFQRSGWQYEFYDDDRATQFLKTHFPPAVREVYDALLPGSYKADLFRYCVLLIMGGVYADIDVMLESDLDGLLPPSVGFMAPQDTPGTKSGHRSCLWNGFVAAAPGHPFLAQTIQNVVNHVRNRYTSVDYDDMLCPNPDFSISHLWVRGVDRKACCSFIAFALTLVFTPLSVASLKDTLLTAGPCILGASVNDVLRLHRQTGFESGDIAPISNHDIGQSDGVDDTQRMDISPDDARLLIPGRSIILRQDRELNRWHRFVWEEMNMVAISTDLPEYDDRPKSLVHYSETHKKLEVYGLDGVYSDPLRANEEIIITILP